MILPGVSSYSVPGCCLLPRTAWCSLQPHVSNPHSPSLSRSVLVLLISPLYQRCSVLLPLAQEAQIAMVVFNHYLHTPSSLVECSNILLSLSCVGFSGKKLDHWPLQHVMSPSPLPGERLQTSPSSTSSSISGGDTVAATELVFVAKKNTRQVASLFSFLPEFHPLTRL